MPRRIRKPKHNHIQPGMLVEPYSLVIIGVYPERIKLSNDFRHYHWDKERGIVGIVLHKMNQRDSFIDSLYPDVHVLVDGNVVVFSADKLTPIKLNDG